MTRIRIVCKGPPAPLNVPDADYPFVNGRATSWTDTYVFLVDADGTERPITNVTGVTWHAKHGPDPASATITFANVEIDAEAEVEVEVDT